MMTISCRSLSSSLLPSLLPYYYAVARKIPTDHINPSNVTFEPFAKMWLKRKSSDQHSSNKENIPEGNPGWKSLFGFTTRRHLPTLILGSIFALVASLVTPALAIFLGNVFDSFNSFGADKTDAKGLRGQVITNCLGMIGLGVGGWFLNGAYYALFVAFGEMQASVIRSRVFLELLKRDVEWFEAKSEGSGALLSGIQA
jgi:ATP-binding cassette subfamily B (MDR/TAP) protein 1